MCERETGRVGWGRKGGRERGSTFVYEKGRERVRSCILREKKKECVCA